MQTGSRGSRAILLLAVAILGGVISALAGKSVGERLRVEAAELHGSSAPRLVVSGAHG